MYRGIAVTGDAPFLFSTLRSIFSQSAPENDGCLIASKAKKSAPLSPNYGNVAP